MHLNSNHKTCRSALAHFQSRVLVLVAVVLPTASPLLSSVSGVDRRSFCTTSTWLGPTIASSVALTSASIPAAASTSQLTKPTLTSPSPLVLAALEFEADLHTILSREPELAGTLLRLTFHDAITRDHRHGGANGSVRLPEEARLRDNRHLAVGLAALTPLVAASGLSWGDAIAVAGAVSVTASGGPALAVDLGREDASEADPAVVARWAKVDPASRPGPGDRGAVVTTLPSPGLDSDGLRRFFGRGRFGLTDEEIVALCGAHTLGRHASLLGLSKPCLKDLTDACIETGRRLPFVAEAPDRFDNDYFVRLLEWNAREIEPGRANFLPTDVALVVDADFRKQVVRFAADQAAFFVVFQRVYRKLTALGLKPTGGRAGGGAEVFTTTVTTTEGTERVDS